jgi:hypothetical protein
VFLLVLALAGPVLRHQTTLRQLGRVIVAVDASESMRLTDAVGGASRWQIAEEVLFKGQHPLLKEISESSDVELVALRGAQAQRLWWRRAGGADTSGSMPSSLVVQPDASLTDLDGTLRQALGVAGAGAALVVLTDGQHNADGSPEEMSRALKSAAVPIFTLGFGAEKSPADLAVVGVEAPESVFDQEVMRGRVTVQDQMPSGLPALVKIEGTAGIVLWKQEFTTEGKGERAFEFSFPVKLLPASLREVDKRLRLCTVTAAVLGDAANTEKTRANNVAELSFHVLDKKRRLLVLDGRARWETRYVHNHFERDDSWDVTLAFDDYEKAGQSSLDKAFPKTEEELLAYDLVIVGDLAAERLGAKRLVWLRKYVEERGGGLIFIDGARAGLRTWSKGEASPLVPVSWTGDAKGATGQLGWNVEPDAARFPALRLSESAVGNAALWPTLPPARWSAMTTAQPGAVTLASVKAPGGSAQPAFVFRNAGAGAVLYISSDELWRWRYQVADLHHQRLWAQLGSWIAAPPFQAEAGTLALGTDHLRYRAGEQAELRVRLKDANGKLVTQGQPRAHLMLDGKDVATLEMEPDPTHAGVYRAVSPPLKPGQWQVAVSASPTTPRSTVRLSLRVSAGGNQELSALTMNRVLLESLARNTAGRFIRAENAADLPSLLEAVDRKQVIVKETNLWSSWWWLGAVIALLTVEWLMRRKLKLV